VSGPALERGGSYQRPEKEYVSERRMTELQEERATVRKNLRQWFDKASGQVLRLDTDPVLHCWQHMPNPNSSRSSSFCVLCSRSFVYSEQRAELRSSGKGRRNRKILFQGTKVRQWCPTCRAPLCTTPVGPYSESCFHVWHRKQRNGARTLPVRDLAAWKKTQHDRTPVEASPSGEQFRRQRVSIKRHRGQGAAAPRTRLRR